MFCPKMEASALKMKDFKNNIYDPMGLDSVG